MVILRVQKYYYFLKYHYNIKKSLGSRIHRTAVICLLARLPVLLFFAFSHYQYAGQSEEIVAQTVDVG